MKKCTKCLIDKPIDEFYNHKSRKDGKTENCKDCIKKYAKDHLDERRENLRRYRKENRELTNKAKREWVANLHPAKRAFYSCKNRAKRTNIEFNITIEDIVIPEMCPILEIPFIKGTKNNYKYTYSLDRIDNSKGYIKGNIQVISMMANIMKNSATVEELEKFCENIPKYLKQIGKLIKK